MNVPTLNALLAVATVGTLWATWTMPRNPAEPNMDTILPNMAHSVPLDAFAEHPLKPASPGMQPPPEGAVAYGVIPLGYGVTLDERTRAGLELTSPVSLQDPQVRASGQILFGRYCAACHGLGGQADGTIVQRGYPAPKSLTDPEILLLKEGEIFHVITYGFKNMPPHNYQVTPDERWQIIAYVRQLQEEAAAQMTTADPVGSTESGTAPIDEVVPSSPPGPPDLVASDTGAPTADVTGQSTDSSNDAAPEGTP